MRIGNLKLIAIAASVIWAAGCSSTSTTSDGDAASSTDTMASDSGAMSSSTADSGASASGSDSMSGSEGMAADVSSIATVFYFDFDKATIKSDGYDDLNAHARYLSLNPEVKVVLEGHTDERGTREYNMALGERRAKAVSRYLTVYGVSSSQIETVSYGEEQPAVMGNTESAWGMNRRVEIKY